MSWGLKTVIVCLPDDLLCRAAMLLTLHILYGLTAVLVFGHYFARQCRRVVYVVAYLSAGRRRCDCGYVIATNYFVFPGYLEHLPALSRKQLRAFRSEYARGGVLASQRLYDLLVLANYWDIAEARFNVHSVANIFEAADNISNHFLRDWIIYVVIQCRSS